MPIETTMTAAGVGLGPASALTRTRTVWFRLGGSLGKLVLTGILLVYLVGWVQDFQRVRHLEAEPTPPSKVIGKYEAWERIYPRPNR